MRMTRGHLIEMLARYLSFKHFSTKFMPTGATETLHIYYYLVVYSQSIELPIIWWTNHCIKRVILSKAYLIKIEESKMLGTGPIGL